jgi:polyphenol oxidase
MQMTEYLKQKQKALTKNAWPVETKNGLPLVFSPLLKKYPALVHAFTTRQGGKSSPPLDSFNIGMPRNADEQLVKDVYANRAKLCQSLNVPFESLIVPGRQIHSANVVMIEAEMEPGEVDGIAVRATYSPVIMQCADCVPILVYDPKNNAVCVIHAGWRGTASGIGTEAVKLMQKECGSKVQDLVCAIGPSIGACCYPVGLEVVVKLVQSLIGDGALKEIAMMIADSNDTAVLKDKNWHAKAQSIIEDQGLSGLFSREDEQIHVDLKAINAYQLLQSGVVEIDVADFCTFCRPDLFYSFRRAYVNNQGKSGHQGAIACLVGPLN